VKHSHICRHPPESSITLPDGTYRYGGSTKWYSSDTKEIFEYNMSLPRSRKLIEDMGWTENNIDYNINDWGFRANNFPNTHDRDSVIALGCSCTFGIGLPEKNTWPVYVSQTMGIETYNLGAAGMGYETNYRTLEYWLPRLKSKYVFMFVNPGVRREYFSDNRDPKHFITLGSWLLGRSKHYTTQELSMFMNEVDAKIAKSRSLWAIKGLCDYYDSKLLIVDTNEHYEGLTINTFLGAQHGNNDDYARDLQHPGPIHNQLLANFFVNYLNGS